MKRISVKHKCGERVVIAHHPPTEGMVTAVFIRGKGRIYEVAYTGKDGPTSVNCDEIELEPIDTALWRGFVSGEETKK